MPSTWNPLDKGSQIVLSGDDLTATNNAAIYNFFSVRGTQSKTSGTRSWVGTIGAFSGGPLLLPGFANGTFSVGAGSAAGDNINSVTYRSDGLVRHNSVTLATLANYAPTDLITYEIDIAGEQVRFKKNAGAFSAWYSVAGIGTTIFPVVTILDPYLITANFAGWDT